MPDQNQSDSHWGVTHFRRRRYPRINVTLPVEYRIIGEPALPKVPAAATRPGPHPRKTHTRTLGGGGLLIETTERLPVGTRLSLTLYLPDVPAGAEVLELSCEVRVAWVDIVSEFQPDEYRCGVEFTDISQSSRDRIHEFIQSHQITATIS